MNRSMINASVTMGQLQRKIDTIGNNIANIDTNGYKSRETSFQDLLVQQFDNQLKEDEEVGRRTPNGIRGGVGAKLAETELKLDQGSIQVTDRDLDLAILKENQFFEVAVNNNGVEEFRYTRDGAFYLSPSADNPELLNLVTANGDFVLGNGGPITIPENFKEININEEGQINVKTRDDGVVTVGRIAMTEVIRPQLLLSLGNNQYGLPNLEELDLAEQDVLNRVPEEVALKQRALEKSNVNMSNEMSNLMLAQRSYQFNAKSISIADQMMQLVNGLRS
ncbi:flagellar hook-basal body protein [Bacillus solimangrovi]|uniref:Flagellar biosynthesis protein FlgG n=1 Tax=Bacillus solimangrovi TaxID=1305675 RepID=A0A1E5LGX8_9BACI|nr:flagellar hook-basal body protein [Bacillus solimangrovi]OEH93341.1 flagellar biosynthesis protein FlgG [Bacillus solimangrovi]